MPSPNIYSGIGGRLQPSSSMGTGPYVYDPVLEAKYGPNRSISRTKKTAAPKARMAGGPIKGGIGALIYRLTDMVIPDIAREAFRGGLILTGQDTKSFDDYHAHKPIVRNLGGVSYDIGTREGFEGYEKAKSRGEKDSTPKASLNRRKKEPERSESRNIYEPDIVEDLTPKTYNLLPPETDDNPLPPKTDDNPLQPDPDDNPPPSETDDNPPPVIEEGVDLNTGQRGIARLDPNAVDLEGVMYRSNFEKGQENMPAMQEYFGSLNTPGLDEWAKANPALAYKEFKKAGQPDMGAIKIEDSEVSLANQFKNNYITEITELLSNKDFDAFPEMGEINKKIGFDIILDPELMERMRQRYTEGFRLF